MAARTCMRREGIFHKNIAANRRTRILEPLFLEICSLTPKKQSVEASAPAVVTATTVIGFSFREFAKRKETEASSGAAGGTCTLSLQGERGRATTRLQVQRDSDQSPERRWREETEDKPAEDAVRRCHGEQNGPDAPTDV